MFINILSFAPNSVIFSIISKVNFLCVQDEFDVKKEQEDDQQQQQPQHQDITFIVDGETGELVPIAVPAEQSVTRQSRRPAELDESDESFWWSANNIVHDN